MLKFRWFHVYSPLNSLNEQARNDICLREVALLATGIR